MESNREGKKLCSLLLSFCVPQGYISILSTFSFVDQGNDPLGICKPGMGRFDLFFADFCSVVITNNFNGYIVTLFRV